jgi:DNA-binding Xre family transcriptional regulator
MTTDEQIDHLLQLLRILLRLSKVLNRDIEQQLGFSQGYLSRLLSGKIDIKISHILDLCGILGIYPHELFAIALAPRGPGLSQGLSQLQKVMPHLVPPALASPPPAPGPPQSLDEVHKKLEAGFSDYLSRVFAEIEGTGSRKAG